MNKRSMDEKTCSAKSCSSWGVLSHSSSHASQPQGGPCRPVCLSEDGSRPLLSTREQCLHLDPGRSLGRGPLRAPPRDRRAEKRLQCSLRALSSVGRAPARQAGGHWFEPSSAHSRNPLETAGFFLPRRRSFDGLRHGQRLVCAHSCPFNCLARTPPAPSAVSLSRCFTTCA